jgi:hypothetical protein
MSHTHLETVLWAAEPFLPRGFLCGFLPVLHAEEDRLRAPLVAMGLRFYPESDRRLARDDGTRAHHRGNLPWLRHQATLLPCHSGHPGAVYNEGLRILCAAMTPRARL